MTNRDREIIETLATKLMGWKKTSDLLFGKYIVFLRANGTYAVEWNPLTDWRAAGEVLETMREHHYELQLTGHTLESQTINALLNGLGPRRIAEAAFKALREPDGDAN